MMKFTVASWALLIALAATPALARTEASVLALTVPTAASPADIPFRGAASNTGMPRNLPAAETPLSAATWLLLVAGLGLVGSRAHRRHITA